MSIQRISTENEDKLINSVKEAIALSNDGVDPSEAIAKVATEKNYNKDFSERMVNMFNTSRTLAHFKDNSGAKRAADFDIADIDKVLSHMYPQIEKAAEIKEIISGKDFMSIKPNSFAKAADVAIPATSPYNRDIAHTISSAVAGKYKFAADVKEAKTQLSAAKDEQLYAFAKAAEYFRTPGATSFQEVDTRMRGTYKQAGELIMDTLWDFLGPWQKHEKRGSHSDSVQLITPDDTPFSYIVDAIEKTEKVAVCKSKVKKTEKAKKDYDEKYSKTFKELHSKTSGDNTLYITADDDEIDDEATMSDTEPAKEPDIQVQDDSEGKDNGVDELQEQYVIEVEVKTATEKSAFMGALEMASKAMGALEEGKKPKDSERDSGLFSDLPATEVESMAKDFSSDMEHMRAGNTLQDLMTYDTVISDYEPEEVAAAYNELVRLHPDISSQPAVLRGYLRRYLESSHDPGTRGLETFDTAQLAGIKPPEANKALGVM
jgi:uncharacterized membrane protein